MSDTVLITTHDLEPAVRLRDAFQKEGYRVELLTSTERIRDVADPVLLVLTGGLAEKRARRLVREAAGTDRLPVLGLAETSSEAAALRGSLADCFTKPADPAEVALVGKRLIERRRLQHITGIIGETAAMQEALERVVQIAPVHSTVLITGESGTGKELVARGIHALSPRRHRPFIAANVAALPDTLLESELFGHEKGAFTGAIAQRKGLFELAHRGTLLLDEIGEMPLATQTKLLRVLEEREFYRVGGEEPIRVDVRVIAATNQDLRGLVELGQFRRDLYYRLNVLNIQLPALRERHADIPLLIEKFLQQAAEEHGLEPVLISPEALRILQEYAWPGNIRELRNLVESMVVFGQGRIVQPEDIPPEVRSSGTRTLLPAPIPRAARGGDGRRTGEGPAPELEFIFRTLMQLRVDMEDIRRDFDEFRRAHPELLTDGVSGPYSLTGPEHAGFPVVPGRRTAIPGGVEIASITAQAAEFDDAEDDDIEDEKIVVFRPGKTMSDLEREAIIAALGEVGGNRRKAAEMLGIGERTLYRKLKEYEIQV
jgi:DNA-binding NtrC family response regulator